MAQPDWGLMLLVGVGVTVAVLAAAAGYEFAQQPGAKATAATGPTLLQRASLGGASQTEIEPVTEPVQVSPLPELMLQLLTLKEGQSAPYQLNGANGTITKGCYDRWIVNTGQQEHTYQTWGDLTEALYKLALNAKSFVVSVHGRPFAVSNAAPRVTLQPANDEDADL